MITEQLRRAVVSHDLVILLSFILWRIYLVCNVIVRSGKRKKIGWFQFVQDNTQAFKILISKSNFLPSLLYIKTSSWCPSWRNHSRTLFTAMASKILTLLNETVFTLKGHIFVFISSKIVHYLTMCVTLDIAWRKRPDNKWYPLLPRRFFKLN